MKTKAVFIMSWAFLLLTFTLFAQAPQKFNYQAVIRDNAGNIVPVQTVGIKISILQGTVDGTLVYSETHSSTTNTFGLVALEIGGGTIVSGDISSIDWGSSIYFIKIELDPSGGTTYSEIGTSQLLSVPYALHAKTAKNVFSGDYIDLSNRPTNVSSFTNDAGYLTSFTETDPVFGIHVSSGILSTDITNWNTAFGWGDHSAEGYLKTEVDGSVTNEIQDLELTGNILTITNNLSPTSIDLNPYMDNTNYWTQSGDDIYNLGNVGIGTTSPQGKLEVQGDGMEVPDEPLFEVKRQDGQTVFAVYPEGVRIYVEEESAKGTKGGFAIGGFNPATKGLTNEFLRVTPDSIRMYVNDDGTKGTKGGFAIGGFSPAVKGVTNEYLRVSPDSVRVYVDGDATKGTKGGFAIGGIRPLKGPDEEYLRVTPDSVRVYINDEGTKGTKGGFAIGGFSPLKGLTGDYMNVSGKTTAEIIDPSEPRVLWYPNKEAFLTGKVLIESPDSVGTNSMATGFESKAIGDYSQAFGYQSIAREDYSTAIGYQAVADDINSFALGQWANAKNEESYAFGRGALAEGFRSFAFGSAGIDSAGVTTGVAHAIGDYSFAIGQGSIASGLGSFTYGIADTASGVYSMALGYKTSASDWFSIAIGSGTVASNTAATAIGYYTIASGPHSTAMGYDTKASGFYSTTMGRETIANGWASTAIGWKTEASGNYSVAAGRETNASGELSTALGLGTTASAYYSTALGIGTEASGSASIASGHLTKASGKYSTAMGDETKAIGNCTIATGWRTIASGIWSTAMGINSRAVGWKSFTLGEGTIARSYNSLVCGRYNDTLITSSLNSWIGTNPLFIIGNGSSESNRSNAMTVLKNGNVGLGTMNPQGTLDVNGSIYQRGVLLHADYVFENEYELESIEEHSDYMWKNKHLPSVPKAIKDENGNDIVEWGARSRGVLEELEKAHVYIDQLNTALKEQQAMIEELKQEIEKLKEVVGSQ